MCGGHSVGPWCNPPSMAALSAGVLFNTPAHPKANSGRVCRETEMEKRPPLFYSNIKDKTESVSESSVRYTQTHKLAMARKRAHKTKGQATTAHIAHARVVTHCTLIHVAVRTRDQFREHKMLMGRSGRSMGTIQITREDASDCSERDQGIAACCFLLFGVSVTGHSVAGHSVAGAV